MAPIVTVTLAFIFLKERLKCVEIVFLGCALCGCLVIVLGDASGSGSSYLTI